MCSRHLAHMIAEYEAARVEGSVRGEEPAASTDGESPDNSANERRGFVDALVARLRR